MPGDAGNDEVYGNEGDDVVHVDAGTDTITDFDPDHDKFCFKECSKASEIDVAAAGGKTFITYGDTTIIVERRGDDR